MSKSKKYYGVILRNHEHGVFDNWDEAKAFIATCPSAAKYKSFTDEDSAFEWMALDGFTSKTIESSAKPELETDVMDGDPRHAIAFVDGSYNADTGYWGYGVVFLTADDKDRNRVVEFSGSGLKHNSARNITGELRATMEAVREALKRGCTRLTIYHDYMGISMWATGGWKAKSEVAQKYADWMSDAMKNQTIGIQFIKVDGHTDVELNERADVLAKRGCGVIG